MTPLTWQRMDTAPKDGTWVLAYDPTIPEPRHLYNIVRRHNDRWENCHGYYVTHATHWMPLPSPPTERTPGEDSAEIVSSERRTSDGPRDPVSSSLRASFVEEADHLAAIDLTEEIAHLRKLGGQDAD
jgi:hypothetical protein